MQRKLFGVCIAAPVSYGIAHFASCEENELWNWSASIRATPVNIFEPESVSEACAIVQNHHKTGSRLRIMGSALSPNGLGFSDDDILAMCNLDEIINIDVQRKRVTVQAGCRIEKLCRELLEHGLTLQNLASISAQQVGGFTQVGAHGTGWDIPPVDMQVVSLKAYVPALGHVYLDEQSELFYWARLSLGALGLINEVTIQCVDSHHFVEEVRTMTFSEMKRCYKDIVRAHKHVKMLYVPYTDTVVVFSLDEIADPSSVVTDREESSEALRELVRRLRGQVPDLDQRSFADLRDMLLVKGFDSVPHIKTLNQAEAEFWKSIKGTAVGRNDELLHFDCGGQQLVYEMVFPVHNDNEKDFIEELLQTIEDNNIPAPAPIEQRWTSHSDSKLSPVYSEDPDQKFCWVGVIMYLPTQDPEDRAKIIQQFENYTHLLRPLMEKYDAQVHWAKIPYCDDPSSLDWTRKQLRKTYPVEDFSALRKTCDPNNVLANHMIDQFFPTERLPIKNEKSRGLGR